MPIITFTTDWGLQDHYAAVVKAIIAKELPEVRLIDISNQAPVFDIVQASFILRNAWPYFPKGSIHIVSVNAEASIETPHILIKNQGQYFIGADNGLFSLLFDESPESIIELEIIQDSDIYTFPARDVFAKTAIHIARGKDLHELGNPKNTLNEKLAFTPVVLKNAIKGKIIYIDHYENLITNISMALFKKQLKNKGFQLSFRSQEYTIRELSSAYGDVHEGEMLALFGSSNFLEIAINKGKAASLLGMQIDDSIRIDHE